MIIIFFDGVLFFRMRCGNKDLYEKSQYSITYVMNLGMLQISLGSLLLL